MPRRINLGFAIALAGGSLAFGAIFPESWGQAKAGNVQAIFLEDTALAAELGFEAGEKAEFQGPTAKFTASAWRFKDPTAALVYYFAARPERAVPPPEPMRKAEPLSVVLPKGLLIGHGNYVLLIEGWTCTPDDLKVLYGTISKLDQSSLPSLPAYLPAEGRKANSERYIIGPVSLERYEARIGAGTAAFSMGAEGVAAAYGTSATLSIFNYPTPEIARLRTDEFRKLNGAVVKRSGPMVIALLGESNSDAAERLLAKVNYQATLTWNEPDPGVVVKNAGKMMVSIFELAGLIGGLAIASGLVFGMLRYARRRFGSADVDETMITLDLGKQ